MKMVLILSFFLKPVLSDYVYILSPEQPYILTEFSIIEAIIREGVVYKQSSWFQYLPLTSTIYAISVGMLDSNCYHLFSSVGKESKSLNFLHYDCLDYEQKSITKFIKFIGSDNQQYSYEFDISIFEYENQWYFFQFILYPYNNRFQIILIKNEEVIKNEILDVLPFQDEIIIQQVGGDLVVLDSKLVNIANGDKFATFPGRVIPIQGDSTIKNFVQAAISLVKSRKACKCESNPISNLMDSDYFSLYQSIYSSKFQNCNQFLFTGWFKIKEIIQTDSEMTFQFIKLTSNMQNDQLQNENLSPLQLFYKLSQNLNTIIITTYSYTFPSVKLDFTNDPFLITKEFQILNKISLWHLLYVKLVEDTLDISINFFENRQAYEYKTQIIVKQFHQIYFKLFLGNLLESTTNYLNIMGRNLYFFNCNQNFQIQNCHLSCGECDGPTNQDCLSCTLESKRVYFPQYKQCLCPYDTIDYDDECLGYQDFGFQVISNEEQNEGCLYGQFELNGSCYQCPGQLNSQAITCLECVLNPKGWSSDPYCDTYIYLNQDGSTSEIMESTLSIEPKYYFTFNGEDLELCLECEQHSLTNLESIYQDMVAKQQSFKSLCVSERSQQQCYQCSIPNCKRCGLLMTDQVCFICEEYYDLVDGFCSTWTIGSFKQNNFCLSPYYTSSTKECKKCSIDNCIYCFEYVLDNLELTTLYRNFKLFNGDDNVQVGCAMCQDGYIFDFRVRLCLKQTPNIEFCLRSYISEEGTEKCTLSSKQDFSVAREIVNCEKFISNCIQCFLTVQSILRCIICKEGYTSSTSEVNGQCTISKLPYQAISIEGNWIDKDMWVQRIQSFMGLYLPNSYFYPFTISPYLNKEIAISCKEGYSLVQSSSCSQYCDSNCQDCQPEGSQFFCNKCPLNYFKHNQRVQINGICQTCSLLCAFCQSRNITEINQTSPYFISTQDIDVFSKKCYLPSQDPNIIIQPHQLIPTYCLDKTCKNNFLYQQYNSACDQGWFMIQDLLNQASIKYLNQVGVQRFIIQLDVPTSDFYCSYGININGLFLRQKLFSLQETNLIINGNRSNFRLGMGKFNSILNFDMFEFSNLTMVLDNIQLNFGDTKVKLKMKDILFIGKNIDQSSLFLNSNQFSGVELVNITIRNVVFSSSSFIHLDSLQFKSELYIETLLIQNSTFVNSNLFLMINNQLSIQIQKLQIENCTLINSTIINLQSNLFIDSLNQISTVVMKNCLLKQQSYLLNFFGLAKLEIAHLYFYGNSLQNSTFFINNYNTSIIDAIIVDNTLSQSSLVIMNGKNVPGYVLFNMDQLKIENLISENSNLFQISTNALFLNLIIEMNNLAIYNLKRQDNLKYQTYIFYIRHCFQCHINQIEIKNINNITTFFFLESNRILIENFKFYQDAKKNQVHFSSSCRQYQLLQKQLIFIQGFNQFKLQNGEITDSQLVDSKVIEITSTLQDQINSKEAIQIKDIYFKRNIIQQNQQSMLSLLGIYSENKQLIIIQNLSFVNNFFHQYEDDPNENSAGLINIYSTQGELQLSNIFCQENAITNSSATFIFITSKSINLKNYIINNNNIINQQLWSEFYKLELDQQYNQDQINKIIQQIYAINVKGGAAKIITEQLVCTNSIFQNILAQTSSIFEIRTLGLGIVKFNNISSNLIYNIKRDSNDNSGCININSQNSNLDLELINSSFRNVQNSMSTVILTVKPSQRKNQISLRQIQIINCFSFLNQIFQIEFSIYNNQKFNQISIRNMTVIFDEEEWIIYLSKFEELSYTEIAQITDDNSIFNIVGGQIEIDHFFIQGIIISTIFKILNALKLEIRYCYINDLKSFYPQQLIIVNLQSNSTVVMEKIEIQQYSIYQLNMEQYQIQKSPQFRVVGCQLQQLSQLTNLNSKILINENINQLSKQTQKLSYSLIKVVSSNSQTKLILNQVKVNQNNCLNYTQGVLFFSLSDFKFVRIDEFQCYQNEVQEYGCLYLKADKSNASQLAVIQNSVFIRNKGSQGTGIQVENIKLVIRQCKLIENYALKTGGGMQLDISNNEFHIQQSIFILNKAKVGGGIFLQQSNNLNAENFLNSFLLFNFAEFYANNLVEAPTHLSIQINQMEIPSVQQHLENQIISTTVIKPYNIIEQGQVLRANQLMIPSNQQIKNYKIYIPKFSLFKSYISIISIHFKNRFNEKMENLDNSSCLIEATIKFENKSSTNSERIVQSLFYDNDVKAIDLSSLSFRFDPYFQDNKILSIQLNCKADNNEQSLQYFIYAKTLKCQQGEFYVDKGCQVCQPNQGFYSVTYNATKCSIFDKEKFENVTSNKIKLLEGFWRPNYFSDYTEQCVKNNQFCTGGWDVGNNLCLEGHLGGLCEECDNFDVRGGECSMFWMLKNVRQALISILITLRSIEKSNRLFSSLKIRQRFSKIIFKLDQDHESILIKMLLNYLWIFSVIFTFNTNFSFSINFIELTSNSSYFMANNLDCYLSSMQSFELIYIRIIAMLILIVIQLLVIWIGFNCYSLCKNWIFNKSIISNTVLYLYVSNYAALVKQFCSILSKRDISNISYLQGDVSLIYGTETHIKWMIIFAIPGLGVIGILIPFSLFFLMYVNRDQLDQIKLRRHICYLFNEYNSESYYWEQIKLSKKIIIIIILTYFESNVLLTASLLGLCLLFYQLLAVKQKPYIIQSLNFLDIQTGQICSISIFISAAKYVSEKENVTPLSVLLQIFIIILCIRLCYPFIINIFRVYFKKYKLPSIDLLHRILRSIKADCFLTKYLNNQLRKLNYKEQRRRTNFTKLRCHLIQISKLQIGHQKHMITMMTSQSTVRYRQTVTITDTDMNKLISP
ncbi:unnamed protein product [Paramecium octaurelia]|uniref:Transmembrane protein n=1 Tax=Paramecium octaurelia TaxID=43137 RepID=A0A8S1WJP6_PAROT|nr:unnamed protein product [Paramecium octaurelia]